MKVILAKPRGFCAGVVRAIEIVERALDKYGPPVYVRHEIVHNKWVVDALKARGARFVEELSEVPPNAITIFSAHGVARKVEAEAQERDLQGAQRHLPAGLQGARARPALRPPGPHRHPDRPCRPSRGRRHARPDPRQGAAGADRSRRRQARLAGRYPARLRDADHALRSTTPAASSPRSTAALRTSTGPARKDICYATQNRQTALLELSKLVDVIFVVGATNSSNSNRLCEIGIEAGTPTHLIANGSEIKPEWLTGVEVVGITAGASAPEVMVKDVIDTLRRIAPVEVSTLPGEDEHIEFRVPRRTPRRDRRRQNQ